MERRVEQRTSELVRANQELESFSYSVSHDLKAPLRVISGFAHLLVDGQTDRLTPKQREYLQLIMENTDQMNELVNALLTFSRITRQVAHVTSVDIRSLVENVIAQEKQAAGVTDTSALRIEIGDLPPAQADPLLLRQVFANLISNALKFSRAVPEPKIEIGVCGERDPLIYFVRDNGVGFPAGDAKKLFHVFHRLHAQSEFEGTGVGLANVRKIIERHGGTVWAEGEEGKGATFYIALPRQPHLSESVPQPSTNS
jgi:light-regulated signal transduction histidine kinase (bacteriophytochrome)